MGVIVSDPRYRTFGDPSESPLPTLWRPVGLGGGPARGTRGGDFVPQLTAAKLLPQLVQEGARRALVVGEGTGSTPGATSGMGIGVTNVGSRPGSRGVVTLRMPVAAREEAKDEYLVVPAQG